jgi:hypothetical protein
LTTTSLFQLKKLINRTAFELESLGLGPVVLQKLLEDADNSSTHSGPSAKEEEKGLESDRTPTPLSPGSEFTDYPKVAYEFVADYGCLETRLRVYLPLNPAFASAWNHYDSEQELEDNPSDQVQRSPGLGTSGSGTHTSLIWALQRRSMQTISEEQQATTIEPHPHNLNLNSSTENIHIDNFTDPAPPQEALIPLISDTAFYQLLLDALQSLSSHLSTVHSNFLNTLEGLSRNIASSARPVSSTSSFRPHSVLSSNPASIGTIRATGHKALDFLPFPFFLPC